jgi:hypothetical protein
VLSTADDQYTMESKGMSVKPTGKLSDGARCTVIGGTHKGKSGMTLAKNVLVQTKPA